MRVRDYGQRGNIEEPSSFTTSAAPFCPFDGETGLLDKTALKVSHVVLYLFLKTIYACLKFVRVFVCSMEQRISSKES